MRPALPGIGLATAMPATGRAGTKPVIGQPPTTDPPVPEAKAAGAADGGGGADDEVPRWAAKALEQLLQVTCWLDPG
ncbi:MAG TPA: hypothetical protein VFE26_00070, partial [Trebonia sp.]|nr:hypothetical protein [Trebonia sp.]